MAQSPASGIYFDGLQDHIECNFKLSPSYTKEAWVNIVPRNGKANNLISGEYTKSSHAFWIFKGEYISAGHNGNWNFVKGE